MRLKSCVLSATKGCAFYSLFPGQGKISAHWYEPRKICAVDSGLAVIPLFGKPSYGLLQHL
jgi:hypothetical protein